jgi:hypothetical protein
MSSDILEIYFNSRTATEYYNGLLSDAMYSLPIIEISKTEKAYICVKNAVIPNSFYNINNTNNKLNLILDGDNFTITFTNGNYNINTFRTHLYDLLFGLNYGPGNNNHRHWTIVYNNKLNKLVYTHQFHNFTFLNTSTCFELMGFKDGFSYTSTGLSLTSTIGCNMFTTKNIYVSSENFILQNIDSNNHGRSNIICSIPVQGVSGSFLFYSDNQRHLVYNTNNLTSFKLKLTDEDGALIDFNDIHYSLTLEITILTDK